MLSEVQCPECGVVLTLPSGSEGRKLKCPNCRKIFVNAAKPVQTPAPVQKPPRPPSGSPGTKPPAPPRIPTAFLDDDTPKAEGPLRDLFGDPVVETNGPPSRRGPADNDALALFQDDPPPRKKPLAGDARRQARRCPTCGGVVPMGMSLCSTCGLDVETGLQVGFDDEIGPQTAPIRSAGTPLGILILGIPCLVVSFTLCVAALVGHQQGTTGAEFLGVISLFGIYASISFIRLRSVKLLFVALTLGLMIDVVGLIAIPAYEAFNNVEVKAVVPVEEDDAEAGFTSVKDQLDVKRVTWGIAIVFVYAVAAVYLNSPPVRKHFKN